jgi:hypothetical protein
MANFPPYTGEPWYDFALYSDYPSTSYHNTDVGTPVDTPLTAPLSGRITADSYQAWGGQLTVQADDPSQIGGHSHYFLIHLDAINPDLAIGQHVSQGDFLGYSGGQLSNAGLKALPAGLQHHTTSRAHSTGPHLDIGVTDSPQGSMDASKTWSDRLVDIAKRLRIPYGTGQGGGGSTALAKPATKDQWARDLLRALGNLNPDQAEVQFLSGWEHAESGKSGGAANNPLNTTKVGIAGATPFNSFTGADGKTYHVWNYPDYQTGIDAEAHVLSLPYYTPLHDALIKPGLASDQALGIPGGHPSAGVVQSLQTWGTSDWPAIYNNLNAGVEPINTSPNGVCDLCKGLPTGVSSVLCAFCGTAPTIAETTGQTVKNAVLPDWLTTPPWENPALLQVLARVGFLLFGGVLILAGGYLMVRSLGEASGIPEKTQQISKRIGAAVATEGASETGQSSQGKSSPKKPAKEQKATPAKKPAAETKPPPSERIGR